MDEKRPQLNLRAACAVGGRPGPLAVAPDASKVFVFDVEAPRITVVGTSRMEVVQKIDLGSHRPGTRLFLGRSEQALYCAGPGNKIAVFDQGSFTVEASIDCGAHACDLGFLPGERQAVLTVSSGAKGGVALLETGKFSCLALLPLLLAPVPETLTLSPRRGLGAALVGSVPGRAEGIVVWSLDPFEHLFTIPVHGGPRSLAFSADGPTLFVACADSSELVVVDVERRQIVQRHRLAGRPFQVQAEPAGRNLWALCEGLGHLAGIDARYGTVSAKVRLDGVESSRNRFSFSPEGRLLVVPETGSGSVALVEIMPRGPRYGELADRLELGRQVACAAWGPLGDEVFVTDEALGAVLALGVDRGDQELKDTNEYLAEQLWKDALPPRRRASPGSSKIDLKLPDPDAPDSGQKNPLFPP